MKNLNNGIIGLAIGDALGVPVEFESREKLQKNPVTDMQEFGTYNQPKGTWSDDTSLTLCLLHSLNKGFDLKHIAENFVMWRNHAIFTAYGERFDIGITTRHSINKLQEILHTKQYHELELLRYNTREDSNGNGSLMRILPLYNEINKKGIEQEFIKIWNVSALTHSHIRSAISCLLYLILIDEIMNEKEKNKAYENTQVRMKKFFENNQISEEEQKHFKRLITEDIRNLKIEEINSGGYVIDSLEASIWCFLTTKTFESAVLKAVNLGKDTDTNGAITGGLAGIYYVNKIPIKWKNNLANLDLIERICNGKDLIGETPEKRSFWTRYYNEWDFN